MGRQVARKAYRTYLFSVTVVNGDKTFEANAWASDERDAERLVRGLYPTAQYVGNAVEVGEDY